MPKYRCWSPDFMQDHEDGTDFEAFDEEAAAGAYAAYTDEHGDCPFLDSEGEEFTVLVQGQGGVQTPFLVKCQVETTYYARPRYPDVLSKNESD